LATLLLAPPIMAVPDQEASMTAQPPTIERPVVAFAERPVVGLPGIEHRTLAGERDGLRQLSVWRQTLAPGAASPPHRHDAEEVVLCHAGSGELHMQGEIYRFGPQTSLLIPRDVPHQIFNTGAQAMEIVAVLAATPVDVFSPDRQRLSLPW
jgi:quercetin dioxygenase-like cupin family protein